MKESEADGDYQVLAWKGGAFQGYLKLFLEPADENLAKLMHQVDFRRALSLAVNRKEINEALYFGLAQPSGTMVGRDSPFYDSRMEAYASFDPTRRSAFSPSSDSRTPTATASCSIPTARTSRSSSTRRPTGSSTRRRRKWWSGSGGTWDSTPS